jgi:hypothetical protein
MTDPDIETNKNPNFVSARTSGGPVNASGD